jgi:hypothetical protein
VLWGFTLKPSTLYCIYLILNKILLKLFAYLINYVCTYLCTYTCKPSASDGNMWICGFADNFNLNIIIIFSLY